MRNAINMPQDDKYPSVYASKLFALYMATFTYAYVFRLVEGCVDGALAIWGKCVTRGWRTVNTSQEQQAKVSRHPNKVLGMQSAMVRQTL